MFRWMTIKLDLGGRCFSARFSGLRAGAAGVQASPFRTGLRATIFLFFSSFL
jgi:hypothetical protein